MVVISGDEISEMIKKELKEIEEHRELNVDLLYNIGSVLITIGLIKNIPTLVFIGKNLFVLPDRIRPWLLSKYGMLGTTEEMEKTYEYIEGLFRKLIEQLDEIAEMMKTKESINNNDVAKTLDFLDRLLTILPSQRS